MTYLSDLPAGPWNDEQVDEAMRRIAVAEAEERGTRLFLEIEEAFAPDASAELHDQALAHFTATMRSLVAQTEQLGVECGFTPDLTRRLVEDRTSACRARLFQIAATFTMRGHA